MSKWKISLSNLTGNTTERLKPRVKKVAFTLIAVTTLSFGILSAPLAKGSETTKVYYVYFNDSFIGTVSDKNVIETVVNEKMKEMSTMYNGFQLSTGSQLTYIPEQVFGSSVTTNNVKVVNELKEKLQIQAQGSAIVIDGTNAVNMESQQQAEEVINQFKLQYVTPEQLAAVEARKADPTIALPALKENESRIVDVRLSKNVSFADVKVTPDQIMTVANAIQYLKTGTLEEKKYQVQEGDVLGSIANSHGLALQEMLAINPGLTADTVLKIGQEVNITVSQARLDVIVDSEALLNEPIAFGKEVVNDNTMPKGDKKVKQAGQNGQQLVTYNISTQNGQTVAKTVVTNNVIKQPVNEVIVNGTKVIPSRGDGSLSWPTVGGYISSPQGYRGGQLHKGIDIARPSAYTIKAADNGVVAFAGYSGSFGNKIMIDHQNGITTLYAHMSSLGVRVGQTVAKGSQIGVMGATGNATGVHLHFEVYKNGQLQNPMSYLR